MHMMEAEISEYCSEHEIDSELVARVHSLALSGKTVQCLSRVFSSLSDPTRLRILHALVVVNEICVCDLAAIAELSVSAVSHQLRLLRDRDLVTSRRDGRNVYYRLADEHISDLMAAGIDHACQR